MKDEPKPARSRHPRLLRLLRLAGDVRPGESVTVLLLLLNVFLLLLAYYILKTAREPLILATGSAELRAYATGAQALLLMGFVPLYGWLAARTDRLRLLLYTTGFFVVGLEIFHLLAVLEVPRLGFVFFVWLGIFVVSAVAQFWSLANDIYPTDTGERLFPLVGIGATLGAPVGARLAAWLFDVGVSVEMMMQIAAGVLVLQILLTWLVHRREKGDKPEGLETQRLRQTAVGNGFRLVLKNRYIGLIAVLLLVLNLVNTTGEYILSKFVKEWAVESTNGSTEAVEAAVGEFFGEFYFYVNLAALLLQTFLVSRIVRRVGIAGVLFALPLVAFGAYSAIALGAGFTILVALKASENATDYSVMNTGKAMLWLPTSRAAKYNAKQAVDTFFVRFGDLIAAGLVFLGASVLGLGTRWFALSNVILAALWVLLTVWIVRRNRQLRGRDQVPPSAAAERRSETSRETPAAAAARRRALAHRRDAEGVV